MNPRISSYADIEDHEGETDVPAAPASVAPVAPARGVAMPTYHEGHRHRGAERVDLGEPVVDDLMDEARLPIVEPPQDPKEDLAAAPAPTKSDPKR